MVKIVRESKSNQFLDDYVATAEGSIEHLQEFYVHKGRAILESELDCECREHYGRTWAYNPILGACVDTRQAQINGRLSRSGQELVYRREDHAYDVTNATLSDIRTSTGTQRNNMPVISPDEHGQCPSGYRFSSLQGGCIPVAEIPEPVSTFAKVDNDLARTATGQSPGDYAR